ncbi:hypothetical protein HAP48_0042590 [Bradyrhizobium septentrionale]|uniref:Uncharacterized protein n=1 Tax=Bradyrhizobium septentrionale TaxID=1404411 RepID=A0A973W3F6_9BRAD|nr:hypothetical protein [Bradyrhizobium septentrionale]UGY15148.1 hypothetical protein HAP48_0042590 [Bradyrhizobium septentrionale]
MEVVEKGHLYAVDGYDGAPQSLIQFMKRVGEGYPGNEGRPHGGTNSQEVLRVLIDRVKYLNGQVPSRHNSLILSALRVALIKFELRAAELHGIEFPVIDQGQPELRSTCPRCGHIVCHGHADE